MTPDDSYETPFQTDSETEATVADEPGKIVADVQSTKLKQMLAGIKQKG